MIKRDELFMIHYSKNLLCLNVDCCTCINREFALGTNFFLRMSMYLKLLTPIFFAPDDCLVIYLHM